MGSFLNIRVIFLTMMGVLVGCCCQTPPPDEAKGVGYYWSNPTIFKACISSQVSFKPHPGVNPADYEYEYDFGDNTGIIRTSNPDVRKVYIRPGQYPANVNLYKGTSEVKLASFPTTVIVQDNPECTASSGASINTLTTFVVRLDDATPSNVGPSTLLSGIDGQVVYEYRNVFRGFAVRTNSVQLNKLGMKSEVDQMYVDEEVSISATQAPVPSWGLDRVDQADLPLSGGFTYTNTGNGVRAYVVDTGIRGSHQEFAGRVGNGFDAYGENKQAADCNGHGTHVAGIIGGQTYGVAKQVTLHPVRVLKCNGGGSWASVLAGLDWVAGNAIKPAIVNMSLGGVVSPTVLAIEEAIKKLSSIGLHVVVAAGNESSDACLKVPARLGQSSDVLTVGATSENDRIAGFSNFGGCVNIFAPGAAIKSAWFDSDTASYGLDGTSMAAPHVAGALAQYLQSNTNATPAQARSALLAASTKNKITGLPAGTVNNLLLAGVTSGGGGGQPSIVITPGDVTLRFAERRSFTAVVGGLSDTRVIWEFSGGGTSSSGNTISYTAPSVESIINISAISMAQPSLRTTVRVRVTNNPLSPPPVQVTLTPPTAILQPGQKVDLVATVTGSTNTKVTWSFPGGGGSSSQNRLSFTAPNEIGTYSVKATSVADPTQSATTVLTVTNRPTNEVVVAITPDSAVLRRGERQVFTVTVRGNANTDVSLELTPVAPGAASIRLEPSAVRSLNLPEGASTQLDFTMPSNSTQDYIFTAISDADNSKRASARIRLNTSP